MMFARDFCKMDIASYHCRERFASKNEVALILLSIPRGMDGC